MQEVRTDSEIPGEYCQRIGFRLRGRDWVVKEKYACTREAELGKDVSKH